ncbi:hypothetical protein P3T18_001186 [Paraburkholderia sp. GAS199]|uniref:hypothetical protein n=1 Tax=Paraburkholderia sp. GAS199 TaxID=3035126 RepID=UPI003D19AB59
MAGLDGVRRQFLAWIPGHPTAGAAFPQCEAIDRPTGTPRTKERLASKNGELYRPISSFCDTVRVNTPNSRLANLLRERFRGLQGELGTSCFYFTQLSPEDDPGTKMDRPTANEELSFSRCRSDFKGNAG